MVAEKLPFVGLGKYAMLERNVASAEFAFVSLHVLHHRGGHLRPATQHITYKTQIGFELL